MVNIIKEEIEIEESLESRLRVICDFCNTTSTIINGSIRRIDKTNLKSKSGVDAVTLNKVLKGTGLSGLGDAYVQAEKTYGVNAIFLISLTAEESGWGRSRRALEDNNLSGFEVYNDSAQGARFNSKHDSIMITGKLLGNSYLKSDGKY